MNTENIKTREDFIKFAKELSQNYKDHKQEWENNKLDLFLDAMATYSNDVQGYYKNWHPEVSADIPSWRVFADILKGSTLYE